MGADGFEKTLLVCQRKEGCAALNHKSFSSLCQISSTLQALKRNKEALLFAFPFSEGDRKLKGAQINRKENKVPGGARRAVAQGLRGAPWCGRRPRVTASDGGAGLSLCTAPRPRAQVEVGQRGASTGEKRERRPSAVRPAVAPGGGAWGAGRGRRGSRLRHLKGGRAVGSASGALAARCCRGFATTIPNLGRRGAERRQKKRTRAG